MKETIRDAWIMNKYSYLYQFKWRNGKNKRVRQVYLFFGVLLISFGAYSLEHAQGLFKLGGEKAIIPTLFAYASIAPIMINLLQAFSFLFEAKDYETLMGLPVAPKAVLIAKILNLYELQFLMSNIFFLPGTLYYIFRSQQLLYLFPILLVVFIAPLLSTVISIFCSFVVSLLPKQNFLRYVVTLAMVLMFFSISRRMDIEGTLSNTMVDNMIMESYKLYPPTFLFAHGFLGGSFLYLLVFCILSIGLMACSVAYLSKRFIKINEKEKKKGKLKKHIWVSEKIRSLPVALLAKEYNRWRLSMQYFVNTIMGIFILVVASIGILILGLDRILDMANISHIKNELMRMAPFLAPTLFITSTPAYAAISLEGENAWILKSLPITRKELIFGKKSLSYVLHATGLFSFFLALLLRGGVETSVLVGILMVGSSFSYFFTTLALMINNFLRDFEWTTEMEPIKQNVALPIMIVLGSVMALFPALMAYFEITSYFFIIVSFSLFCTGVGMIFDFLLRKNYYI